MKDKTGIKNKKSDQLPTREETIDDTFKRFQKFAEVVGPQGLRYIVRYEFHVNQKFWFRTLIKNYQHHNLQFFNPGFFNIVTLFYILARIFMYTDDSFGHLFLLPGFRIP